MSGTKEPTYGNGKICYVELPAQDIQQSAEFYRAVFGWRVRTRSDGSVAFDDAVNEVSGSWVLGRKPAAEPGLMVYLMVDSVATTCESIIARGGKIVQPIGGDAPEITARFSDPAGNIVGLYQMPLNCSPAEHTIISTRVIAAPRDLIWKAWTDAKHLAQWFGPNGFRNTFQEFDPRPGGHWRFVMHGPDGKDYQNHSVFLDATKPERIAFDHISGPRFCALITFEEKGSQTKVTFRQIFDSAAESERMKSLCVPSNEQNFDRLEAELRKMS